MINKKIIGCIVSLALFMDALDTTIINTAIPMMAKSLQVHPVDLKIALISYLVTLAIFIPISGWMADKYGNKNMFIISLIIFTLGSFCCGYASTLPELIVARCIQGLGGAFMLPVGRLILLHTYERHELVQAMNTIVIIVSMALMLGPFIGGTITDHFSWPWIFWVNVPVGIAAVLIARYFLQDTRARKVRPFDLLGFILFGGGLAALTFSFSDLSESSAHQSTALIIMLIAIILLIIYFRYAKYQRHSIINTSLLSIRTFRISMLGNICSRLGFGGIPFLLPLLMQIGLGMSAQLSGLLIAPLAIGVIVVKIISLKILRLLGYKRLLIINTVLVGFSLWSFLIITMNITTYMIAVLTFIFGLLISMQFSGMNSLAYSDISSDDLSSATSLISTIQQLSQSIGVAVSAMLLRLYSITSSQFIVLNIKIFHETFFTLGLITFVSALIFMRLQIGDGRQMLNAPKQKNIALR